MAQCMTSACVSALVPMNPLDSRSMISDGTFDRLALRMYRFLRSWNRMGVRESFLACLVMRYCVVW